MENLNKKELNVISGVLNSVNTKASTYLPFTNGFNVEEYILENLSYAEIDNLHEKINKLQGE